MVSLGDNLLRVIPKSLSNRSFSSRSFSSRSFGSRPASGISVKEDTAFTEEQKEEFKETFSLFDKEGDGTISVKDIGTVLRGMGQHPTEAYIQELVSKYEMEGHMTIEFPAFLDHLAKIIKETDPETELTEAFKIFDKENSGNISNEELRRIMVTYGETLTDEEVEEMIREADTDGDGIVDYTEFVAQLISD